MSALEGLAVAASVVGHVLVVLGVALVAVAALGLVRLPDPFSRLSAVTKSGVAGVCLVLLGVLGIHPSWSALATVVLAVALQLLTNPVGGFALGRAAYRSGAPLSSRTRYDELAGEASEDRTGDAPDRATPRRAPTLER
ncbi:monovalent cation/H(+) antiporter subunit G [Aquipuribacter sp. SD81]|uniref:monovalent cation/H(+) antiporter subunit G n=1 Tax=Aquipuribacter sp. SD81 TaxID=3127703 RepID=UPI00301A6E0A